MTIAAFGLSEKTFETDVGKSVWSAPLVPPAMFESSEKISAIAASASFTDWSVHGISCVASWSYLSAPAWRM